MNDFGEVQEFEETGDGYSQYDSSEANEIDELQDFSEEDSDLTTALSEKSNEISALEHEYDQAKLSIDMARTPEEQDYWDRRSNETHEQIDEAEYMLQLSQNSNDVNELQDYSEEDSDLTSALSEKSNEISALEHEYDQAKLSIDMARTPEEQDYWNRRSNELYELKDAAAAEYWQLKNNNKK